MAKNETLNKNNLFQLWWGYEENWITTSVERFPCCQGIKSFVCGMVRCLFSLTSQQIKRGQRVHYIAPQSDEETVHGGGAKSFIAFDWLLSLISEMIGNIRFSGTILHWLTLLSVGQSWSCLCCGLVLPPPFEKNKFSDETKVSATAKSLRLTVCVTVKCFEIAYKLNAPFYQNNIVTKDVTKLLSFSPLHVIGL